MALADLAAYLDRLGARTRENIVQAKVEAFINSTSGTFHSGWTLTPFAGATPSTAAVPTSATTGALGQQNSSSELRVGEIEMSAGDSGGYYMLCDRLSHQGGLSGTVTTAQTTNLPTAALTRYTDGENVWPMVEIYTQVGTTATTLTASYTNQAGTSGRTSQAIPFGGTGNREARRIIPLPLQAGDTGVRSVESVTVLATTGTAGNFGITLLRPRAVLVLPRGRTQTNPAVANMFTLGGQFPKIEDDACLFWIAMVTGGVTMGLNANINFVET